MATAEIRYQLHVVAQQRHLRYRGADQPLSPLCPRITRLMALAIRLDTLLGEVRGLSYTELAGLAGVSPSRITQILNLLYLAPDLQERLLFLEPNRAGREVIHEAALRRLTQIDDWREQRRHFDALFAKRTHAQGEQDT